jgi:type II secretory pathway pseudopilin PulG
MLEVLAAITIITIVLPTIMYGISLATNAATLAKHRTQATTLAQAKLDELLVTGEWQNGNLAGDYEDHPEYHWTASQSSFPSPTVDGLIATLQQLDVTVTWKERNTQRQAILTTLLYQNASSSSGGGFFQ